MCYLQQVVKFTECLIHWYQKLTFHKVFSFQILLTCRSHTSVDSSQTKFFLQKYTKHKKPKTQRMITLERVVSMKIIDNLLFLKQPTPLPSPILATPPSLWEQSETPPFSKISKTQNPLYKKRRDPTICSSYLTYFLKCCRIILWQ